MLPTQGKPLLYIVINNHFDLTWRRCWQRPFTFHGQAFVSYTDLQAYYMLDNLDLAERHPEYKFEAESTQVVRKFLERCPEKRPALQQLIDEKRFAITGGGESIVDANMITGESLVRNYVDGLLWVEETFGQKTRLAVRNDAFGNSAQLPQILRGCEIQWATGMSYSPADNRYWRGLDGSTILVQTLPVLDRAGGVIKYPPCPACAGTGKQEKGACPDCGGRGIDPDLRALLPDEIDHQAVIGSGAGLVLMAPEELLPNPALLEWADQKRANFDVRFALEEEALPHLQDWLADVDNAPADCLHSSVELNPNNSGCLVTRIKTKQTVRRQEYALQAVEALSVMAALKGAAYPKEALEEIRRQQNFTIFHDAITATHVDAAYHELEDIWQDIDARISVSQAEALSALACPEENAAVFSVINPTGNTVTGRCTATVPSSTTAVRLLDEQGIPATVIETRSAGDGLVAIDFIASAIPPFSARQFIVQPGDPGKPLEALPSPVIENARYRIQADKNGLVSILDKALNRAILAANEHRPGELVLEHDEGSPWATLSPDQHRIPLAPYTRLVRAEQGPAFQRLVFTVDTPREMGLSGQCLRAQVTVTLYEGLEHVDFKVHADWDAFNHRLRVAMSVPGNQPGRHVYEIPYGMVTRAPYDPWFRWAGANGDWPAINWAGVEQPGMSVALFNQGTPSYRIEPDEEHIGETIFLSLLRSPAIPTYLHEPQYYSMTEWDGMRDSGAHDFAFAIRAYPEPFAKSSVVLDADAYNTPLIATGGTVDLPAMPVVQSRVARLAAVKWAAANDGLILRLVEFRGQGGLVEIRLPFAVRSAAKVNLLERHPEDLEIIDQVVLVNVRPWEIATVKVGV